MQTHQDLYGSLKEIITATNSDSFKYKTALVGKIKDSSGANDTLKRFVRNTEKVVPLKYLSNFWRSLEVPLINCKTLN